MSSLLLLKTRPQIVIPELAVRLGLTEALLLQQVQYWLSETTSGIEYQGRRWIYNTLEEWCNQFPYLSESTIKRGFTSLKKVGVLNVEQINKRAHDRTNYYSINYEHALLTEEVKLTPSSSSAEAIRTGQNDLIDKRKMKRSNSAKVTSSNGSNWPDLTESTTKNTQESTTESSSSCPVHAEPDTQAELVLEHFNRVTNSSYRDGKSTMGHIRARLAEDYVANDLILVTDYITAKWLNDSKMSDYLRPKTLFSPENCMEYFEKAQKWHEAGRPECVNGKWLKPGEVAVSIDTVARDEAFTRIIGSRSKPQTRTEEIAAELAGKTGIRTAKEFQGRQMWINIWKQATEQAAKEVAA